MVQEPISKFFKNIILYSLHKQLWRSNNEPKLSWKWSFSEGLITALAIGGFFIILGLVALTPGIAQHTNTFISDQTTVTSYFGSSTVNLPAPAHPAEHLGFYTAVMNFLLGIGILQIVILGPQVIGEIAD